MRKIRYSAGMKAVVMLMQEIFAVVLVVCILLVSTLFNRSMLKPGDLNNSSFTESKYYEDVFQKAVGEVLTFISYKKQFETDGVYNPAKAVNIMAYMNSNSHSANSREPIKNSDRFRYYLIDLENWSKEYVKLPFRVESRLYLEEEDVHQVQEVYINEDIVRESDTIVRSLNEMDASLQKQIAVQAQYYYGGYYAIEEIESGGTGAASASIFTEVYEQSSDQDTVQPQAQSDGGIAGQSDEQSEGGAEETEDTKGSNAAEALPDSAEDRAGEPAQDKDGDSASSEKKEAKTEENLLKEIKQKVIDGKLFQLEGKELALVIKDLNLENFSAKIENTVLEEKYLTVEESSIVSEFLSDAITLQEMEWIYESLEYTLATIGEEITAYKRMVNRYEKNESNLQFWVYEENANQYYSNMGNAAYEDFQSVGKAMGSYFYYNKNDIRLDTNVNGMEEVFYEKLERQNGGRSSIIFVGMDTTFPKEDHYKQIMQEFQRLQPWASFAFLSAVISVFGCFLCFFYLNLAAGHSWKGSGIQLNRFDRVKTEFLLAGFVGVCIGARVVVAQMRLMFEGSDLVGLLIMAGGMTFTIVALFMAFYLSFVRRLKAQTLWNDSFFAWVLRGIGKIVRNWNPSVRILLAFGGHILITLAMAVIALTWSREKGVVLFMLVLYLLLCATEALAFLRGGVQKNVLMRGIQKIAGGDLEFEIDTEQLKGDNKMLGEAINTISEGLYRAVDDSIKNERLKTDLITNVSHDIKTPLTSIINYVDLLKREDLENERAKNYIAVLDAKSQRLKQLTEDLVEASKISSGNITLQIDRLNLVELVYQTAGEFNERFEERGLTAVTRMPREPVIILADGRRIWRVLENLYNNVAKYAMEHTRVYVDMQVLEHMACFSIKNISDQALNIDASELTERFIRGDVSRSTEGSGLGLSIAKNLTNLMGGTFEIYLDGDLFKVTVTFPVAEKEV